MAAINKQKQKQSVHMHRSRKNCPVVTDRALPWFALLEQYLVSRVIRVTSTA